MILVRLKMELLNRIISNIPDFYPFNQYKKGEEK